MNYNYYEASCECKWWARDENGIGEMFRNVLGTLIETRYNKEMLVKTKFLAKKEFMALDFVKLITKNSLDMKCSLLIVFT